MPTGPEHYREAERLTALAIQQRERENPDDRWPLSALTMAQAQVHATLAAAAAAAHEVVRSPDYKVADKAWAEVAGPPPPTPIPSAWDLLKPH